MYIDLLERFSRGANNTTLAYAETVVEPISIDLGERWRNATHFPYDTIDPIDKDFLEDKLGFFAFYGIILPIMTFLGCIGNLLGFFVYHHPEMRCLSTMFISAILISDTFYALGTTILMAPRAWVSHLHFDPDDDDTFWRYLNLSQEMFLGMYPLTEMAQCLVVWYTLALALEQYMVIYSPIRLWKYSTRDKGLKIITTIIVTTILVHMVHFFKFVRYDVYFSGVGHSHKKICLTDIYRSQHFQTYEKILYYIAFRTIPWIIIILLLPKTIVGVITTRLSFPNRIPDLKLVRVYKSGRSSKINVVILIVFVLCATVSNIMYSLAVEHMNFDQFLAGCHLTPSTRRFDELPKNREFFFVFFMVFYSTFKFPLCYVASFEFRKLVCQFVCWPRTNRDKIREIMLYVVSNKSDEFEN